MSHDGERGKAAMPRDGTAMKVRLCSHRAGSHLLPSSDFQVFGAFTATPGGLFAAAAAAARAFMTVRADPTCASTSSYVESQH